MKKLVCIFSSMLLILSLGISPFAGGKVVSNGDNAQWIIQGALNNDVNAKNSQELNVTIDENNRIIYTAKATKKEVGWQLTTKNQWQYQREDGSLVRNQWFLDNNMWYHFNNAGEMELGWFRDNETGFVYYLDTENSRGNLLTQIQNIDGFYYYFGTTGALVANADFGGGVSTNSEGKITVNGVVQIGTKKANQSEDGLTFDSVKTQRTFVSGSGGGGSGRSNSLKEETTTEEPTTEETTTEPTTEETSPPETEPVPSELDYVFPSPINTAGNFNSFGQTLADYITSHFSDVATNFTIQFNVNCDLDNAEYRNAIFITATDSQTKRACYKQFGTTENLIFYTDGEHFVLPKSIEVGGKTIQPFFYGLSKCSYFKTHIHRFSVDNLILHTDKCVASMFRDLSAITEVVGVDEWDTEGITDYSDFYNGCTALTTPHCDDFNFDSAKSAQRMFKGCSALTELKMLNFKAQALESNALVNMLYGNSSLATIIMPPAGFTALNSAADYGDCMLTRTLGANWASVTETTYSEGVTKYTKATTAGLKLETLNLEIASDSQVEILDEEEVASPSEAKSESIEETSAAADSLESSIENDDAMETTLETIVETNGEEETTTGEFLEEELGLNDENTYEETTETIKFQATSSTVSS